MTGTLYGTATFHWVRGFYFGAGLGLLAALTLIFLVRRPTVEQMETAVRKHAEAEARKGRAKPVAA
jgi:hypothetical protein